MGRGRAGEYEGACAEDHCAEECQPVFAQQPAQIEVGGQSRGEDEQQVREVEGAGGRQQGAQAVEQEHVRQAEVVIGERYAMGEELQVGEVKVGAGGEDLAVVPGIPEEHKDVVALGRQPKNSRIEDVAECGPGHDDDCQRRDEGELPVPAQRIHDAPGCPHLWRLDAGARMGETPPQILARSRERRKLESLSGIVTFLSRPRV